MCICVVGDFNSVRSPSERIGRGEGGDARDILAFEELIGESGLIDMPLVGKFLRGTSRMDRARVDWIASL